MFKILELLTAHFYYTVKKLSPSKGGKGQAHEVDARNIQSVLPPLVREEPEMGNDNITLDVGVCIFWLAFGIGNASSMEDYPNFKVKPKSVIQHPLYHPIHHSKRPYYASICKEIFISLAGHLGFFCLYRWGCTFRFLLTHAKKLQLLNNNTKYSSTKSPYQNLKLFYIPVHSLTLRGHHELY